MENGNSEDYQNSGYKFSPRKERGKRKSTARHSTLSSTEDAKSEPETVESVADHKSLESSLDKLNIEDEPVFNENTINTRALRKEAVTYELENFEKNALIIFDQENIDGFRPSHGTEIDVESLMKTFTNFGFEVTRYKDLTKDKLLEKLKAFSKRDFTDYGCVAVAVLTHGTNNGLLRAKDLLYSVIEIINHFKDPNKPLLVTKPKLIIIRDDAGQQLHQGLATSSTTNQLSSASEETVSSDNLHHEICGPKTKSGVAVLELGKIRKELDKDLEPYILPIESDLLILHNIGNVGSLSHRDELCGSWFIQVLCNKINTLSPIHDFESISTEVKREVAINKQHEQTLVLSSTLIRKLYLRKFGEGPKEETYVDKLRRPSESRREVQDAVNNSAFTTPGLDQFWVMVLIFGTFYLLKELVEALR